MWIACEGIDGSGKTTVSVRVARRLREQGLRVLHVREGGSFRSRLAGRVRDLTRDQELASIAPESELLLNAAREAQVIAEEIRPALARGEVVITDRGLFSHIVLSRAVRGLARLDVNEIAEFAAGGLWPDQVIYFDVDPDVARYRKRLRKIRDRRLGSSTRKGLLGSKLVRLSRAAFLALASNDPHRWHVLENTWRSVSEAEAEMMALVAPRLGLPAPPRPPSPPDLRVAEAERVEEWADSYLDFAEHVASRDPALATLWVAGLQDPRSEAIRERALEECPEVVAWTVGGQDTPEAWTIRRRAVDRAPYHVARSLIGLGHEVSWKWRERLLGEVPEQVLYSVGGQARPEAHALRRRLWDQAPEEGLRSLSGLGDATSWGFRCQAMARGATAALAESLKGLDTRAAWGMRERMQPDFPVSVLRGAAGSRDERAWRWREEMKASAPRLVLDTLYGMDGERARRLRAELSGDLPDEAASSLGPLDTEEAWGLRRDLVEMGPVGVLESLRGLSRDPRASEVMERALSLSGGRARVVRKVVSLHQAASAVESPLAEA